MPKILVVDDDRDLVELAEVMLEDEHEVVGTTSVSRAIEFITTGRFWLLITDIRMPELSGFQLIERAKAISSNLTVLILSAFYDASEPLSRQVIDRYADLALAKPLDRRALKGAVHGLELCAVRARRYS